MRRRSTSCAWVVLALCASATACSTGDTSAEGSGSLTAPSGNPTDTEGSADGTGGPDDDGGTVGNTGGIDDSGGPSTTGPGTGTDDGPGICVDVDGDGYGDDCDAGPDCNDNNPNAWTDEGCANCADADGDTVWAGCDGYDDNTLGPDCDDNNDNVFTDAGCANCADMDMDMVWAGCDVYDEDKVGPDCDDNNPVVGTTEVEELCDGIAQNCAGEIDPLPADMMCPPQGVSAPNVDVWVCNPPAPGEDGCQISACDDQFFDLDGQVSGGCECAGTPRTVSLAACGDAVEGYLGSAAEGEQLMGIPVGTIPLIDNGVGGGAEDWYRVEFPVGAATGARPLTGSIRVQFAINEGNDYRFEVYRTCGGAAWASGLATVFGAGAPPAREWWFFDNHTAPINMPVPALYTDNVTWPDTVYVRVFRVQNDNTCNNYQLQIQRVSN